MERKMISKQKCKQIIELAVKHARRKADGIEVSIDGSDVATSRFACNSMTQNQCPDSVTVSVRAIIDGKQARQSTDDYSASGIRKVVDNAIASAKMLEPDENLMPLPDGKLIKQPGSSAANSAPSRYDARTARLTAADRADFVREIISVAKQHNLVSSGVYASGTEFSAIGNSKGLFQYHRQTTAECSITMEGATSSGWAKEHTVKVGDFSTRQLAEKTADLAVRGANPRELAPGRYKVILPPSAVLDLLTFIWYDFSGTAHTDQVSSLINKLGKLVFGKNITIVDDAYHPLQAGPPFDGEGLPRSKVTLVENGVLKNLVHSRKSAQVHGVQPTGHTLEQPSADGECVSNLIVSGGETSIEEMIRGLDRGVLLTRVWYVRTVDPETVLLTGMTRDGTFLVENGKIAYPILNFRFNVSIHELLNNVLALSPTVRAGGEEGAPTVVPAMLVDNFNFTEVTKF
jgi:predicted Zn-dependent protease